MKMLCVLWQQQIAGIKGYIMYNDNKIIDLLGGSMDGNILVNVGEQRFDRPREEKKLYME